MTTQTVRSAINRADSAAYDAQRDVEICVKHIEDWLDRLKTATAELRQAREQLREAKQLADTHGLDHEIPYNAM